MSGFIVNFLERILDRSSYPKNPGDWLFHFASEAANGSPQAMTELGWAYIRDDGILPRHEGKSWAWFEMAIVCGGNREVFEYAKALAFCKNALFFEVIEKAIARDYAPAFFLMGTSLHSGVFAAKDLAGALIQYRLAADRGHIPARVFLLRFERCGFRKLLGYLEIAPLMWRYARIWWRDNDDPRVLM